MRHELRCDSNSDRQRGHGASQGQTRKRKPTAWGSRLSCECLGNFLLMHVLQSKFGCGDMEFQSFKPGNTRLAGKDMAFNRIQFLFLAVLKQETFQDFFRRMFNKWVSHYDWALLPSPKSKE